MHLFQDEFYHIYNRGNNQQPIFFNSDNYFFFIKKIKEQLLPVADIISYCLMPNHFHLIVHANESSVKERNSFGGKPMQEFAYRIGILQSSYAQAINKKNNTSGSLFQQKSKAKILSEDIDGRKMSYLENCFYYVHQNPKAAGIVDKLAGWPYSSYLEYVGLREDGFCSKELFLNVTGLTVDAIKCQTYWDLPDDDIKKLY